MRLGQTATVVVEAPAVEGLVRLPISAVFELKGQSTVWLVDKATMTVKPQVVKVAGGTEADLEMMVAPGSNVTVRNYAFEPQTALSVGAQLRDGELIVTSLQVCRDANDKGKMYRHWQHVTELDVP